MAPPHLARLDKSKRIDKKSKKDKKHKKRHKDDKKHKKHKKSKKSRVSSDSESDSASKQTRNIDLAKNLVGEDKIKDAEPKIEERKDEPTNIKDTASKGVENVSMTTA